MKCNHDCLNCKFADCIENDLPDEMVKLSLEEYETSNLVDEWAINAKEEISDSYTRNTKRGRPSKTLTEKQKTKKLYYLQNKERIAAYQKKYAKEHAKELKAKRNTEEHRAYMREYMRKRNADKKYIEERKKKAHESYLKRKQQLIEDVG